MRRFFTDDSLEDFLKQSTDRFQLRPSDKVWKGISENLKRKNRRIGWFTGLFVTATSVAVYLLSQQHPGAGTLASLPSGELNATGSTLLSTGMQTAIAINADSRNTNGNNVNEEARQSITNANPLRVAASSRSIPGRRQRSVSVKPSNHQGVIDEATPSAFYTGFESDEPGRDITDASLADPAIAAQPDLADAPVTPGTTVSPLAKGRGNRVSLQFFFTPTVSYRSLSENKDYTSSSAMNSASPSYAELYNVNDAVTHKPSIGLEVGLTAKYALDRNLRIQGGLQFNMSRYEVEAFDNATPQLATVAYNGGGSTNRSTTYSNMSGEGRKDWLQNMYFQVSAPIGVELQLAGNSKTQFGIASTIQPTYILSDRVYMLSTDYKNYAEVPWLVRRFNVNTALSTYVGYSTGKINWQVGPQVRYQLFSSFVSKYPVKENLFDFGLRVGVSLNKGSH
jgi:hypothetical protein